MKGHEKQGKEFSIAHWRDNSDFSLPVHKYRTRQGVTDFTFIQTRLTRSVDEALDGDPTRE